MGREYKFSLHHHSYPFLEVGLWRDKVAYQTESPLVFDPITSNNWQSRCQQSGQNEPQTNRQVYRRN